MCDLLRYYHIDNHTAELASIDTFYHELAYNEILQAILCCNHGITIFNVNISEHIFICLFLNEITCIYIVRLTKVISLKIIIWIFLS